MPSRNGSQTSPYISSRQYADATGQEIRAVQRQCKSGLLNAVQTATGRWRIDEAELEPFEALSSGRRQFGGRDDEDE
ncbi:MAG: hypothetical protein K6E40_04650 [Desulfovibrio sp.]|nr:hypothetical protein [Desulfovibrio sp.]